MPWKTWDRETKTWQSASAGYQHDLPPPVDDDGKPWREPRSHFPRSVPPPEEPIPWKSSAPFPISQMRPGTSRHLELVRGELNIQDARTDYEIRWLNEKGETDQEIWPPDTLVKDIAEHPIPEINAQWKELAYSKAECEEYILDGSKPIIQRVSCLVDRIYDCRHEYSRFDLVEKGLAMLHDLKFHVQGDNDWIKICSLEHQLHKLTPTGKTKDDIDPRQWRLECRITTAGFIRKQFVQMMELEGYDMDREFARVFGLESSPRVKRGEAPIEWEGWDPNGPVDWGLYRIVQKPVNGLRYGHISPKTASKQPDEDKESDSIGQDEESWDEDEEDDEGLYDEEEEYEDETQARQDDAYNDEPQLLEDDGESDLEEITPDQFREISQARESEGIREPSSDIEITGSQTLDAFREPMDDYSDEDEERQLEQSQAEDLVNDEEDEEGMDYDQEDFFEENGQAFYRDPRLQSGHQQLEQDEYGNVRGPNDRSPEVESYVEDENEADDESIADSEDLQILEEHQTGGPAFEDELDTGPTMYAIKAAERAGIPDDVAEDVFDEQGRAYAVDLTEADARDEVEAGEMMQFVPATASEVDSPLNFEKHSNEAQAEVQPDSYYQDFEPQNGLEPLQRPAEPSGVASPLSSMASQEMVEIDQAFTGHGFTELAKRAMQGAGANHSVKTSETSGLSSPPSSQQTEDESQSAESPEDDGVDQEDVHVRSSPEVIVSQKSPIRSDQIDPALGEPPTPNRVRRRSSIQTPKTPRTSFQASSQSSPTKTVTPFRLEHPRTATGVIVPDQAQTQPQQEGEEDENKSE